MVAPAIDLPESVRTRSAAPPESGGLSDSVGEPPVPAPAQDATQTTPQTQPVEAEPELSKIERRQRRTSVALLILTALAVMYTLYSARAILLPITTSLMLALTVRPMVRRLRKWHVPDYVSAIAILAGLVTFLLIGISTVIMPARAWVESAPQQFPKLREKLSAVQRPFKALTDTSERVKELTKSPPGDQPVPVEVQPSQLSTQLAWASETSNAVGTMVVILVVTFFMLTDGDRLLANVLSLLPTMTEKRRTVELVYEVERGIARYLFTVSLINIGLGIATAVIMWLTGVPNPILWGVLATLLNYIPFFGPLVCFVILVLVSLLSFESLLWAALPPLAFCAVSAVEGNILTPAILGRSISLNPIVVFLALVFWGWIWGFGGAILAVPLLAVIKIGSETFEATKPLARLLSA